MIGLQRGNINESLSNCALTSADPVSLGTDLDPVDGYNNLWAAKTASKALVQCNLGNRVIDAENVGFSYGEDVERRLKKYWPREV